MLAGFWVHYSAPGAGVGLGSAGAASTSLGGWLSTTAVPTGSTIGSMFPGFARFNRSGDKAQRTLWRLLFAVNNTGASVNPTLLYSNGFASMGLPEFANPLFNLTCTMYAFWDSTAASVWASATQQATTWQSGTLTAAQLIANDNPSFGGDDVIPQGSCRGFWVGQKIGTGNAPGTLGYETVSGSFVLNVTP